MVINEEAWSICVGHGRIQSTSNYTWSHTVGVLTSYVAKLNDQCSLPRLDITDVM